MLVPVTNGVAFLPWSNSRTMTWREQRRPLIHRLIADGLLPDGYATENGTGLVFFGTELDSAFTEVEGKLAYSLTRERGQTREVTLEPGFSDPPCGHQHDMARPADVTRRPPPSPTRRARCRCRGPSGAPDRASHP
jgi:hypothetical protein